MKLTDKSSLADDTCGLSTLHEDTRSSCPHILLSDNHSVSGDDFSNNLFTDLAPLIALFGEQVSKQFLSQSLFVCDCLLFAAAPLGIITGVVSAIRLSKYGWLKAVVGRAVEPRGAAGLELSSATSSDVCELWDGKSVVRVLGQPSILTIVYTDSSSKSSCSFAPDSDHQASKPDQISLGSVDSDGDDESHTGSVVEESTDEQGQSLRVARIHDFESAKQSRLFTSASLPVQSKPTKSVQNVGWTQDDDVIAPQVDDPRPFLPPIPPIPPNLALNIAARPSQTMIVLSSLVAVAVQLVPIALAFLPMADPNSPGSRSRSWRSGATLFSTGTLFVFLGLSNCAFSILKSKRTEFWTGARATDGKSLAPKLMWLQKQQVVNDQSFPASAVFPHHQALAVSLLDERGVMSWQFASVWTLAGIFLSLAGFVIQFVGLRTLSWTISVAQLVAMMVNTCLRVSVRLPFRNRHNCQGLTKDLELEWATFNIHGCRRWSVKCAPTNLPRYRLQKAGDAVAAMLDSRIKLGEMAQEIRWRPPQEEDSMIIKLTTEALLNALWSLQDSLLPTGADLNVLTWPFYLHEEAPTLHKSSRWNARNIFTLTARRQRHAGGWGKWHLDIRPVEALLSLWLYDLLQQEIPSRFQASGEEKATDEGTDIDDLYSTKLQEYTWAVAPISPISCLDFDTWTRRSHNAFTVEDHHPDHAIFLDKDRVVFRSPQCELNLNQWRPGGDIDHHLTNRRYLAMSTRSTLSLMCGRYMVASALRHVLRHFRPLSVPAIVTGNLKVGISSLVAESVPLEMLSQALTDNRLMNEQDALAILVPALRERELMPSTVSSLNEGPSVYSAHFAFRYAYGFLQLGQWSTSKSLAEAVFKYCCNVEHPSKIHCCRVLRDSSQLLIQLTTEALDKDCHFEPNSGELTSGGDSIRAVPLSSGLHRFSDEMTVTPPLHASKLGQLADILSSSDVDQRLAVATSSTDPPDVLLTLMQLASDPATKDQLEICKSFLAVAVTSRSDILSVLLFYARKPIIFDAHDENPLFVAIQSNNLDATKLMLSAGLSPESRGADGRTPLQSAAAAAKLDQLRLLVSLDAKVDAPVRGYMMTALATAVKAQALDVVEFLLQSGADPNPPLRHYGNPLQLAASTTVALVEMLVAYGADVNYPHCAGTSDALTESKLAGKSNITDYLERRGATSTTACTHASSALPDGVSSRICQFPRRDRPDKGSYVVGWTELQIAAYEGDEVRVAALLTHENINAPPAVFKGRTALQAAAEQGHDAVVAMLLPFSDLVEQSASVGGTTALKAATKMGHWAIVRRLLMAGADVHEPAGVEEGTALQLACQSGCFGAVRELLMAGADVDAAPAEVGGLSALQIAEESGNTAISQELRTFRRPPSSKEVK